MSNSIKRNKKLQPSKKIGRYATPEEAAQAKNAGLIAQIKKIGLKVSKTNSNNK